MLACFLSEDLNERALKRIHAHLYWVVHGASVRSIGFCIVGMANLHTLNPPGSVIFIKQINNNLGN